MSRSKDELTLHADRFKDAARQAAPDEPGEPLSADPATDAVLRAFTRDGRIVSVPVRRCRRRLLLEHVAAAFEPGVRYPEKEVNAALRAWYADYAALRRYLVDEALLDRADGLYWRIGGPVPVGVPVGVPAGVTAGVPAGEVQADVPAGEAPVERFQRVPRTASPATGTACCCPRLGRSVHKGRWTLPGGGAGLRERPGDAVVRECTRRPACTYGWRSCSTPTPSSPGLVPDGVRREAHSVRFVYRVTVLGGTLGVVEVDGSTEARSGGRSPTCRR